jgi:hypothetical protein
MADGRPRRSNPGTEVKGASQYYEGCAAANRSSKLSHAVKRAWARRNAEITSTTSSSECTARGKREDFVAAALGNRERRLLGEALAVRREPTHR